MTSNIRFFAPAVVAMLFIGAAGTAMAQSASTSFATLTPVVGSAIVFDPSRITAVANLPYFEANARVAGQGMFQKLLSLYPTALRPPPPNPLR